METSATTSLYCDNPDAISGTVERHVGRHDLLGGVSRLGLAVSGGADSVALLHLVVPLCRDKGVAVSVLHANHGLRKESAQEELFVRDLAARMGLDCLSEELRLAARPRDGDSLEMAARAARQSFFAACCREARLDAVATGHQADDVAETLLLRLARGAGVSGLAVLRPRSPASSRLAREAGHPYAIVRPLLPVSGRALREWLTQRHLTWCEDASNRSLDIPRNRVRHLVLPELIKAWGAALPANLCRSADILRTEDALLDEWAARRLRSVCRSKSLEIRSLMRMPEALRRRVLRLWLFTEGLPEASGYERVLSVLDLCASQPSGCVQLGLGARAIVADGTLRIESGLRIPPADAQLPAEGRVGWEGLEIQSERVRGIWSEANGVGNYPAVCTIDAEKAGRRQIVIRSRRPGDRIAPTGMTGSKKLHDLFIDAKVPEKRRDSVPVFVCGDDVVWIPGYRVSRAYALSSPDAHGLRLSVREAHRVI